VTTGRRAGGPSSLKSFKRTGPPARPAGAAMAARLPTRGRATLGADKTDGTHVTASTASAASR
jgi:hypothetical protein